MTAPRLARAGRSRFFIFVGIVLLMVGFVAIFNNSQQQLDALKQVGIKCEQQQKTLADQMKFVVDSKFRLEKSLANERLMHDQTQQELQLKAKEEKEIYEKKLLDINTRYSSLQQAYKLLESENEDLKDECAKTKDLKKQKLEELRAYEEKHKILQEKLLQSKQEKEKEIDQWKKKYKFESDKNLLCSNDHQLKDKLEKSEKLLNEYKRNCNYKNSYETLNQQQVEQPTLNEKDPEKHFVAQIPVSVDLYKISIKTTNKTQNIKIKESNTNNLMMENLYKRNLNGDGKSKGDGIIINSVENFQIIPKQKSDTDKNNNDDNNVLQEPPELKSKASTPSSANKKKNFDNVNNKLLIPIDVTPTVTHSDKLKPSNKIPLKIFNELKLKSKVIPLGVVPIKNVPHELGLNDDHVNIKEIRQINDNNKDSLNNFNKRDSSNNNFLNANENENGAHEINDNDFNIIEDKNHKDHLQEVLDDEKINVNNAAEDDTNIYDRNVENDVNLEVIHKRSQKKPIISNPNDKLINEIVADQGKVAEYPDDIREDLHMEEQADEEDDDDYANPAARKQEPAVRN